MQIPERLHHLEPGEFALVLGEAPVFFHVREQIATGNQRYEEMAQTILLFPHHINYAADVGMADLAHDRDFGDDVEI